MSNSGGTDADTGGSSSSETTAPAATAATTEGEVASLFQHVMNYGSSAASSSAPQPAPPPGFPPMVPPQDTSGVNPMVMHMMQMQQSMQQQMFFMQQQWMAHGSGIHNTVSILNIVLSQFLGVPPICLHCLGPPLVCFIP